MTVNPPMPEAAQARLADLRNRQSTGGALATTDLSVDEFLLVHNAGFDPLAMVVGSSVYHTGYQPGSWGNQELQVLTAAMYNARELAMSRMVAEADAVGADGIVGVELTIRGLEWGEELSEFTAIGTAVRARAGGSWRTDAAQPFTSNLSGQDFWKLLTTGHRPLGMVVGNCVYHVAHQSWKQWRQQMRQNTEVDVFTQGLYTSRELAMSRMQAEAERLGADLVVETRVAHHSHFWGSHVMEFLSIGTAVRKFADTGDAIRPAVVVSTDRG